MGIVCGVDGCKGGWVLLVKDLETGVIDWRLCASVRDIVSGRTMPQVIAIDIPIGLPDRGPRACDLEARRLLGRGRGSTVFPAPIRSVLGARSYETACRLRFRAEKKKLSLQTWGIVSKIRQVDEILRQDRGLRSLFYEVHPEVSFYFMAGGRSMKNGKKSTAGSEERRNLLTALYGTRVRAALAARKMLASAEDDILDAFAALWTAERIAAGKSRTLPAIVSHDSCGLLMEIKA